jgi:hypothetical protein
MDTSAQIKQLQVLFFMVVAPPTSLILLQSGIMPKSCLEAEVKEERAASYTSPNASCILHLAADPH